MRLKTLPHLDAATEAKHLVLWTSDDAEAALDGLDKKARTELKSLTTPPGDVLNVTAAVQFMTAPKGTFFIKTCCEWWMDFPKGSILRRRLNLTFFLFSGGFKIQLSRCSCSRLELSPLPHHDSSYDSPHIVASMTDCPKDYHPDIENGEKHG